MNTARLNPLAALGAGTVALLLGIAAGAGSPAHVSAKPAVPELCERYAGLPGAGPRAGMVQVPPGRFTMGSDRHYAEEMEPHEVTLDGFWIDRHDVTNAQFARFVAATGYRSRAERGRADDTDPGLPPAMRVPGSAVFVFGAAGQPSRWRFVPGANWRHPEGPGSHIDDRANHPVVHIAYEDALAYARWLGRDLPTEAQWEYAARGGLDDKAYAWGDTFTPGGKAMANTWQGPFPVSNTVETRSRAPRPWAVSRPTAGACTTWPATSGNGRPAGTGPATPTPHSATPPARPSATASTPDNPASRPASSRAAPTCARPTTACVTARPPGSRASRAWAPRT